MGSIRGMEAESARIDRERQVWLEEHPYADKGAGELVEIMIRNYGERESSSQGGEQYRIARDELNGRSSSGFPIDGTSVDINNIVF